MFDVDGDGTGDADDSDDGDVKNSHDGDLDVDFCNGNENLYHHLFPSTCTPGLLWCYANVRKPNNLHCLLQTEHIS